MSESVAIVFTADISDLQRGLREANTAVGETTATLKSGAAQTAISFADLTRAYAAGVAQRLDLVQSGSNAELAIARAGERAETDILLDGVKAKESAVKQQTQIAQLSYDDERTALLALEADRESIELRHLQFLQSTYQNNAVAYANVQRQIDELTAQSALRRQQIEQQYVRQVYESYRTTFEQIGSSVSQQVTGLISGQESLRQAVANVLLSIIQDFVAARLKIVADWAAGVLAETAATSAGEAAKTSAVAAGTAARTSVQEAGAVASLATSLLTIGKSIIASAAETFAGIFGFLAPILGPAAAAPAAAGQATVLAVGASLPSFDTGAWNLPADMIAQVHKGEMIVPAGVAAQIRGGAVAASVTVQHSSNFNVTALDAGGVKRFFSSHGRAILSAINDGVRNGSHLGLSKLGQA
jgi:hypothetical protein